MPCPISPEIALDVATNCEEIAADNVSGDIQFVSVKHTGGKPIRLAQHLSRNLKVVYLASEYRTIELLLAFRMAHSDTLIHQVCDTPSAKSIPSALRQGDCELAVLVNPEDPADEFVKIPLVEDVPVAVLYSVHPLAERPFVTFDDLRNENFVALDFNSMNLNGVIPPGDIVRSIFQAHNAAPNIVFTANRGTEMLDYIHRPDPPCRKDTGLSLLSEEPEIFLRSADLPVFRGKCYGKRHD